MGDDRARVAVILDRQSAGRHADTTLAAVDHAAAHVGAPVVAVETPSTALADFGGQGWAGVVAGPGSPYVDPEAVLGVVRLARERGLPLVGT